MMQSTLSYAHPRAADLFSMCLYERYYKDLKILNLCKSFVQAPLHLVTATGSSMFWNKNSIVKRINEVEETAFVRPKVWHSKESEHSELQKLHFEFEHQSVSRRNVSFAVTLRRNFLAFTRRWVTLLIASHSQILTDCNFAWPFPRQIVCKTLH